MRASKVAKREAADSAPTASLSTASSSSVSSSSSSSLAASLQTAQSASAALKRETLERFIALGVRYPGGFRDAEIKDEFGELSAGVMDAINVLLSKSRLQLAKDKANNTVYLLIEENKANKLEGLTAPEMTVLQLIEKEGNKGITHADIRKRGPLKTGDTIRRVLATLEKRKLIKAEKSIASKNRKVWMLYDIQPALDVAGRCWFQSGEYDQEVHSVLEKLVLACITKHIQANLEQVAEFLRISGVLNVPCEDDDVDAILMGLVHQGTLEIVPDDSSNRQIDAIKVEHKAPSKRKREDDGRLYRHARAAYERSVATRIPCSACPVASQCFSPNAVNPIDCAYLSEWLQF